MDTDDLPGAENEEDHRTEDRLTSWKEIAAYLKRDVRTVHRWEKDQGLPVHRHVHQKAASVYAYRSELEAWWRGKAQQESVVADSTANSAGAPAEGTRTARRSLRLPLALSAVLIGAAILLLWQSRGRRGNTSERVMIAVLPFQNIGGGAARDYFCDGLNEELITELAILDPTRVGVIARSSAMAYKNGGKSIHQIGQELGVAYVIEGSVRFEPDKSRITTQLIRVSDQSHLWAGTYDTSIINALGAEQQISREVATTVGRRFGAAYPKSVAQASVDTEAYHLYLQGRDLFDRRDHADLEQSLLLFDQALQRDPYFARAYAAIADSYNQLGYLGFRPLGLTIPKAQDAANRALAIDPNLADAHAALGFINAMWLWDWKEAESRYQRALQLDPAYTPAHHYYALFLASAGRLQEAKERIAEAEKIDPLSVPVVVGAAYIYYFDRDYQKSIDYCKRALSRDPNYAIAFAMLGWNFAQLQRYPESIAALKRGLELSPSNPLYLATLGRIYVLSGDRLHAVNVLQQLDSLSKQKWVGGSARAIIYAAQNDRDSALHWLNIAAQQEDGFLLWLKVTPEFDGLRGDPQFRQLLAKVGLPSGNVGP